MQDLSAQKYVRGLKEGCCCIVFVGAFKQINALCIVYCTHCVLVVDCSTQLKVVLRIIKEHSREI